MPKPKWFFIDYVQALPEPPLTPEQQAARAAEVAALKAFIQQHQLPRVSVLPPPPPAPEPPLGPPAKPTPAEANEVAAFKAFIQKHQLPRISVTPKRRRPGKAKD